MNKNALRQKILDLAIHGKLVNEELGDRNETLDDRRKTLALQEEKSHGLDFANAKPETQKAGKSLDFPNPCDNISKDEEPFELPQGWKWVRLGEICETIPTKKYQILEKEIKKIGKYPVISQSGNYIEGYTDNENAVFQVSESPVVVFGDHTRNVKYIDFNFVVGADGVKLLKPKDIFPKYLYYAVLYSSTKIENRGYGRHFQFINKMFYPLPPLAEQKLIVAKIEQIFAQIDFLEQNKSDLQNAVRQAKSKILDLAIHGKLVPQDPNDENASVLLEKLRAEKEEKIAKGELKRDKNDSYIYKGSDNRHYEKFADGKIEEIEVPFELPDLWRWCSFGEIATVINGKNQSKVENPNGQYPIYGSGGVMGRADDYICPENCTVIGRKGSINNPIFVAEKFWNVDTAFGLCANNAVLPKFLFYFCKTFDFTTIDSSTTLPSLTKTNIQQILFPLPPLAEQKRIVAKIESLFSALNKIQAAAE